MSRPIKKVLNKEVRSFWEKNPVAAEGIKADQEPLNFTKFLTPFARVMIVSPTTTQI